MQASIGRRGSKFPTTNALLALCAVGFCVAFWLGVLLLFEYLR